MPAKFYQYDKCSTCRNAQKFLEGQGIAFEKIDITEKPPTRAELERMIETYEGDFKKLFNTSGLVYREMKLGEKMKALSKSEALKLLASNGRLVKRPFLISDKVAVVGFKPEEWKRQL